jgi:hypothetical protein
VSAVDRISAVLRNVIRTELGLQSGDYFSSDVFDKAAQAVVADLKLTEEEAPSMPHWIRYTTPWEQR